MIEPSSDTAGRDGTSPAGSREGRFIVFEGVEGAGKSTQARRLAGRLEELGLPHRLMREPGGTRAGERIREIVLDPTLDPTAEMELLLMLAARAELVRRVVRPALARGEVVIADRYELSTLAYQGVARGLGVERVRALNEWATGGLHPDIVLLLTLEPAAGLARKCGTRDRLERAGDDFHESVARAYRELAGLDAPAIEIPSDGGTEDVESRIWKELAARWPVHFPPGALSARS